MSARTQIKIPATYMRGQVPSKGVFFKLDDLPEFAQQAGSSSVTHCYCES